MRNLFGLLLTLGLSFEASESEKCFEFGIVDFRPSLDFGEGGDIADESEKDDGKHGRKGMRLSLFGSGIADVLEAPDEVGQGCDVEHVDLREWEKGSETIQLLSLLREKKRNVGQKKEIYTKYLLEDCWG